MNYPKISVVTPSFNQGEFLEATITSVTKQSYPNLEYIIIDGGSTDNSVDIIKKYSNELKYWISEPDNGLYDAVQKGFEKSTGEIMCWINSDDMLYPASLKIIADVFMQFPNVSWIQGTPTVFDEQGRTVFVKNTRRWSKYDYFAGDKEHIQQESTFWRRSLWESAGGFVNTKLKLAGDYELWSRFFEHAELFCVQTILGGFRVRIHNQLSVERMNEYNKEVSQVLAERMKRLNSEEEKIFKLYRDYLNADKAGSLKSFLTGEKQIPFSYPPLIVFNSRARVFEKQNP
jgi:glycosyltransferase involved in cell wall biosynthesis